MPQINKVVINNIQKSFNLEKGVKTGIYANTAQNRKDGKVGQKYSKDKEETQVYHNSYSEAISSALKDVKRKGYEVSEDEVWSKISTGPKKPKEGDTNKISLELTKNGKEQKKMLHIQIHGMKNKYELNSYIN